MPLFPFLFFPTSLLREHLLGIIVADPEIKKKAATATSWGLLLGERGRGHHMILASIAENLCEECCKNGGIT